MIARIANAAMACLFAFAAALQWNDPDPLPWIGIYGAAAVVAGLAMARRDAWTFGAAVGGVAGVWAAVLATRTVGVVDFRHIFDEFQMTRGDAGVEEARELVGLAIVAAWMIFVSVSSKRRTR